jgi:tetratricopeptide (TPR) repeat protein
MLPSAPAEGASVIPLGAFELASLIGRGGMGEVWAGVHRAQTLPVAVKVVTAELAQLPRFVDIFRAEVHAVARLDHPSIVMVFETGLIPEETERASEGRLVAGSPYLAMELADAESLQSVCGLLPWPKLRTTLLGLLDALAHAHARGVIHRDLKPSNVLLAGPTHELKLSDFGLAHVLDRASVAGMDDMVCGTPAYMAPEQFEARTRDVGSWTDLYSLGCMAYALACGDPPFGRSSRHRHLRTAHQFWAPPPLCPCRPVPPGFEDWVRRLLEKDPSRRYQWAADAARALFALDARVHDEAQGQGAEPGDEAQASTVVFVTLDWTDLETRFDRPRPRAPGGEASAVLPSTGEPPAPPASWHRPEQPRASGRLLGAGLGLWGLRSIPLVDRIEERDRMWAALGRVCREGTARALLLEGPSGCGKSRLAEWLCERTAELAVAQPVRAVYGPTAGPHDGLGTMLSRHLGCVGLGRAEVLERIDAALRRLPGAFPGEAEALAEIVAPVVASEEATGSRRIRFGSPADRLALVRRYLEWLGRVRPVVVWLDDVQWGFEGLSFVVDLLDAQTASPAPILAVLTVRDDALAEREAERVLLDSLQRNPRVDRLAVGPLRRDDWPALVRELLGLEGELAASVEERTAGNPLFAVQLVGDWVARGALEVSDHGFRLCAGSSADLPRDLDQVWTERVERVLRSRPPDEGTALEIAAVLGQDVDGSEWASACAQAAVSASPGLIDVLAKARLARSEPDGEGAGWSFVHGMLRESIVLRARGTGGHVAHHRACARMLRERSGPGIAERLGRHLLAAGDLEAALEPLLSGVTERTVLGEYRLAELLLRDRERAMDELGLQPDDPRRSGGWLSRSEILLEVGDTAEAESWAERAERAARERDARSVVARALLLRARCLERRGQRALAEELVVPAEQLCLEIGDGSLLARCRYVLAWLLATRGRLDAARERFRLAVEGFEVLGDANGAGWACVGLGDVEKQAGRLEQASELVRRAQEHFDRCGSRPGMARVQNSLGELARAQGRPKDAEAHYREAHARSAAMGRAERFIVELNLALSLLEQDRHEEARALLEGSMPAFRGAEGWGFSGTVHACLLVPAAVRRDWAAFDEHLAAARKLLGETEVVDLDVARVARRAAGLARAAEEPERSRAAAALAVEQLEALGRRDLVEAWSTELGAAGGLPA